VKQEKLQQLASLLKTKIDLIIRDELSDPRLRLMSIVHLKVSKELDSAIVYVSHPGDEATRKDVAKILEKAAGFLEGKLRNSIRMRHIPKLIFRLDDSMIKAARIEELLNTIKNDSTEEMSEGIKNEPEVEEEIESDAKEEDE
jgi:ribosome-binding factor A